MNNRSRNLKTLVLGAILAAVTLVLGMTPMGIIPLGFINVTIMCIPVVVGTVCCGLKVGLILGAAFGIASACSALGFPWCPQARLCLCSWRKAPIRWCSCASCRGFCCQWWCIWSIRVLPKE